MQKSYKNESAPFQRKIDEALDIFSFDIICNINNMLIPRDLLKQPKLIILSD
jgi:hypothetical protein